MKIFWASLRVILGLSVVAMAAEYFWGTDTESAFARPELQIFLGFLALVFIVVEVVIFRVGYVSDKILTEEQKQIRAAEQANSWWGKFYQKMLDQKPLDKESEIILDHNYDGIQELDNNLPPWWVFLFYGCIAFAGVYLVYYHIIDPQPSDVTSTMNYHQVKELENEMAVAKEKVEAYKKANPGLVDIDNVTALTETSDLDAGKDIYMANCIACHAPDGGGGIGPNLTDQYWILGGGIKDVFRTISEGGREGQGMVPWKGVLQPKQIQQVASYVLTLQGTTPANPKAPQGDVWTE